MTQDPIIICENLVKIYKVADLEVLALQGLELSVQKGEMMGIVGASGSGKSTLMNVLGGLIRPSAGRVWVDGNDLLKMSDAALNRYRRTKVGFVWQQGARNLIPYLNALENVSLPMTLAGQSGRKTRQRAEELLELVGLAARRHHYMRQLSGGEQQRVAIAVALANQPTCKMGKWRSNRGGRRGEGGVLRLFLSLPKEAVAEPVEVLRTSVGGGEWGSGRGQDKKRRKAGEEAIP